MNISKDCVVSFHYTLTNEAGDTLDSSAGQDPLAYLHGAGNIIPGLEKEMEGKIAGDKFVVTVQPEEAYGVRMEEMIQEVPKAAFQGAETIEPGMQFQAQGPDGQVQMVTVAAVSEETVTVDANHPLAGVVLNFDVSVENVREASAEEIDHGHVH